MTETNYTEPIIAFRRWTVSDRGGLQGIGFSTLWSDKYMKAECKGSYRYVMLPSENNKNIYAPLDEFVTVLPGVSHVRINLGNGNRKIESIIVDDKDVTESLRPSLDKLKIISTCRIGNDCPVEHEAPHFRSHCGIYAHNLPIRECNCGYMPAFDHGVIGAVRLWGRTIEHDLGFRAEHAEIAGVVDLSHGQFDNSRYGVRVFPDLDSLYHEWTPDWDAERDGYSEGHEASYCGNPLSTLPAAFHTLQVTFSTPERKKNISRLITQLWVHNLYDIPSTMKWQRAPRFVSRLRPEGKIAWRDPRNDNLIELFGERGARWNTPDGSSTVIAQ